MSCQHPNDNHSDDLTTVYYGAPTTVTLCGFHISQLGAVMFEDLRAAGVI